MRLIGQDIVEQFKLKHPSSRKNLDAWVSIIRGTDFVHHQHLKKTFNSVDYTAGDTIFDICGNRFRLIAQVQYQFKTILIKKIMTHPEYERWKK